MRTRLAGLVTALPIITLSSFVFGCEEAPEGIRADHPFLPGFSGGLEVGVTPDGEGRARFAISGGGEDGLEGFRAHLSTDGGATFTERRPRNRFSPDASTTFVMDGLTPGTTYTFRLVTVTNLGIESVTEGAPLNVVDVPLASIDLDPPPAPSGLFATSFPGELVLEWIEPSLDTYRYFVERSIDAAPFERIGTRLAHSAPTFNDRVRDAGLVSGQLVTYRVSAEDLSGNVGVASLESSVVIP